MLKVKAYQNYFGGKNSNGTYQTIINKIPPHQTYMSLFLGNCAVTRYIEPAKNNLLNDIDKDVYSKWFALLLPENYLLTNTDALALIKKYLIDGQYDRADTFIYLDPPYILKSRKSQVKVYTHEMTDQQHIDLLRLVKQIKFAKVMISHYPNDLYDTELRGWQTHDFYSIIRNGVALERLYMNYEQDGRLHDYRFLGDGFRERERNNRKINNMVAKVNRLDPLLKEAVLKKLIDLKTK